MHNQRMDALWDHEILIFILINYLQSFLLLNYKLLLIVWFIENYICHQNKKQIFKEKFKNS